MYRSKVKRWNKIFHKNGIQKKAKLAILISNKIDFKTKEINKENSLYNDKRVNSEGGRNYHKCIRAANFIKQTLIGLKGEMDSIIFIVDDLFLFLFADRVSLWHSR
jgi:hypothetical protein